ncbi:CHC2 zinc finger domain-containing protein [Moraxella canis]|uniref:DNA primase n=1 Tax=Moraxella canis TaxID=90239 RepID=A0ABZ0WYR1_9GAMM|nr:CHC2 zinc finger domain-containing protein [Moraxella canis]WQE04163.1 CHC2 zinc finger domain-containing protein [Moraxella canis]
MNIPESIIEQLNSQADLVGMIGKHTTLKAAGREYKGCCPFHGEKTPSFYVNPETNLYYCFGCHAKGNPITFLKEFERMSFIESVKYLSEQTGIELPKDDAYQKKFKYKKTTKAQGAKPPTQSSPDANIAQHTAEQQPDILPSPTTDWTNDLSAYDTYFGLDDAHQLSYTEPYDTQAPVLTQSPSEAQGDLYTLLDAVHDYYQFMLGSFAFAKQYFLDRGLSEETIQTFGLGYAPEGWQHLEQVFPQDIEGLKILGLVRESSKGNGRNFCLLRHRVIFPIRDNQGRVVGFAGRSLGDENPKYINSSESPVFQKQHILYGLYESRRQKAKDYLLVEGYMDVIALYQAGIYGAVAPMGTAANEKQIERLLRYNNQLTLCFDGDSAGQRAAWRTLEIAAPVLSDGRELKFLTLPDNHDPDTYLKSHGAAAMRDAIESAVSLSDYIYGVLASQYDLTRPESKAQAMATLRQLTELLPKGSSLKWWLNSDIYQKLKAVGKEGRFSPKVDLINYSRRDEADAITEIGLHLIHTPILLKSDPLAFVIEHSGMPQAHIPLSNHLERQEIDLPKLPNWASFKSPLLDEIIAIISTLPDEILQDSAETAQSCAYFIIAALSDVNKSQIQLHWQRFIQSWCNQDLQAITPVFYGLICTALKDILLKQQNDSKNLILSEVYKRRLQALVHWDNIHNKSKLAEILTK